MLKDLLPPCPARSAAPPVYVQNSGGLPLMPTTRYGKVRRLLKAGLAKPVSSRPFAIRLCYETPDITQALYGGIAPGRGKIGAAVVNGKGETLFAAELATRSREIPELIRERALHRHASRRGERMRRKRRARRNSTTATFPRGRKLPGRCDIMMPKDIINSEWRLANRRRKPGWMTPTARHCAQTHVNLIRKINAILPVSRWTLPYGRHAYLEQARGKIRGVNPQTWRICGFPDAQAYIGAAQNGHCALCPAPIAAYARLPARFRHSPDGPDNLIGLCSACHAKIYRDGQKRLLNPVFIKRKEGVTFIT